MPTQRTRADVELLEKLVLGQLPVAEADRLAIEYADDSLLVELVEALSGQRDTLLDSLRNHRTVDDSNVERLVARLVERLKVPASGAAAGETLNLPVEVPSEQLPIPDSFEYFRIKQVLGQGGMGTVYLADDTRLDRPVALKTLKRELAANPAAKGRFLREARSAARLEHDNIIPIYYVGEANGTPFLAMPVLQGEPLDRRIQRQTKLHRPMPVAEAIRIARQIASGLAAAHAQGLIHRDIKPANIWLEASPGRQTAEPRVKILDFGLARSQTDTSLTDSGAIVGTPAYMAPEQGRGLPLDHRADLFSLGVVLYEMLTGNRPFTGPDTMSILTSLALDTPLAPHTINPLCSPVLSQLTMQLIAKQPHQRPASATVVVEALARIATPIVEVTEVTAPNDWADIDDSGDTERIATLVEPKRPTVTARRKRRLLPYVAIGLLLAILGVSSVFGGTIIRFATNQGELVIEVDDPTIEVKIVQNGVVVEDKTAKREFTLTASKGEIEVFEKDGVKLKTKEFELTRGGKSRVKVTFQELADARKPKDPRGRDPKGSADADRRAAEYVLSIDGMVMTKETGSEREIKAIGDLPRGAFELTVLSLNWNPKATDAGLANCKNCKNLTYLHLDGTKVSDLGLINFKDCKNLTHLGLHGTQVSDAGLALFKGCKDLTHFDVGGCTSVSDTGLAHFKDCKNLTYLDPNSTQLSDAGLAYFKNCKSLMSLRVGGPQVTDAGLAYFKDCKNLTTLDVGGPQVTDAGLAHFKDCKNLTTLRVSGPQVTDAGLAYFKDCKNLLGLQLSGTKVSEAGLLYFKDCKKLGGLYLEGSPANDAWLAHFKNWKTTLGQLLLGNTQVTDAGLAHLKDCDIYVLQLVGTQVSDAGLAHLKGFKHLGGLDLRQTKVTAAGVAMLQAALPQCKITSDFPSPADPDRKAAEWFVNNQATIIVECAGQLTNQIRTADKLPNRPFTIRTIWLAPKTPLDGALENLRHLTGVENLNLDVSWISDGWLDRLASYPGIARNLKHIVLNNSQLTDDGMAHLKRFSNLQQLTVGSPTLTDKGLAALGGMKLRYLTISGLGITDGGMEHLRGLVDLTGLGLFQTSVSDAGLVYLKALPALDQLTLRGGKFTDRGLKTLAEFPQLFQLSLSEFPITDQSLAVLKDCKGLSMLYVHNSKVTDAGLAYLTGLDLVELQLGKCDVGDAGLETLAKLKKLNRVDLKETKATEAGVKKLAAALPKCMIFSDHGNFAPASADPDRKAAEWVLSIGGVVHVNKLDNVIRTAADLPREQFSLAGFEVGGIVKVTDAELAQFKDCQNLVGFDLSNTPVSDAGLALFAGRKNLTRLGLSGTKVTDAGLAHFKDCKYLTWLGLNNTKVSDAGLAHFKECKNLTWLNLSATQVSDAGLAHFKDCKNLEGLMVHHTQVSDAGLAHFKDCRNLTHLHLSATQVSDAGLEHFKDCKNITLLSLDSTKVSDAGLAHFKDCQNLTALELGCPKVSDAGLAHFKKCKNLTQLNLSGTQGSDAGLAQFKDCRSLTHLTLLKTKITAAGIEELKKALPQCKIEWDGGVIEPGKK